MNPDDPISQDDALQSEPQVRSSASLGGPFDNPNTVHEMYLYLIAQQPLCAKCRTHSARVNSDGVCASCEYLESKVPPNSD